MAFNGETWNEGAPVNSDLAADIDDYIRDAKIGVRSRMENEHNWRASQSATGSDGHHKFITLTTQTSQPGLIYGTATQAAAIYAASTGTGVSVVIRNSAGYVATLMDSTYLGGGIIPKGGIIMWSGTIAAIPFGWALCDGNNGTPNLTNRFVVCAGADGGTYTAGVDDVAGTGDYAPGASGGQDTHKLITDEMPEHNHGIAAGTGVPTGAGSNTVSSSGGVTWNTQNAGGDEAHENRPRYYALAFIQKL